MIVRENAKIKRGSAEYEVIKRQVLDLYVITENATACYELWRRAVDGEEYSDTAKRGTAANFFKQEKHVEYMDGKRAELAQWGFDLYSRMNNLDTTEFKAKTDKYADIENITPDELRTKNLTELEELKNNTQDPVLKANIIKQQTDLMDAKMKKEEVQNTDKFVHYYLPMPYCNGCPIKPNKKEEK